MTARQAEIAIGMKLGRYEFKSRLAIGGMAEVWLAEASGISGFKKTVVLKTILPQYADDPNFVTMFTNEALLASGLNHANIVQIFDLGEIDSISFIAMEYIAGRTLRQIQRALAKEKRGAPPWLVIHVCMAVCDALDYAHNFSEGGQSLSMVHRDVTPENIMISYAGVTKVLDFGIAKARSASHSTQVGTLKGKFAYMGPERIISASEESQTDRRSDIYSIGVMLYELLCGTLPFTDDNELLLLRKIIDREPPKPRAICPWIPESLEQVVLKAMAKDLKRRYQTAAEMREDLSLFLVEQRATTTTDRHVARFLAALFTDDGAEAGSATQVRRSKLQGTPIALTGFDAVKGVERLQTGSVGGPSTGPVQTDTATRATSLGAEKATLRVLSVDADGVTRRFVERSLTRDGFEVETAKGATAALEILQSEPIDLIVCESDLPDMTGLQFQRRLSQETRYREIPVLFLSANSRPTAKIVAVRAGVDEFVEKPCEAPELVARVRSLIARRRRERHTLQHQHQVLAGDLGVLGFPVLVGMLEMGRRTGTLTVTTERAVGALLFDKGQVTHASFGSLSGEAAFYRMLAEVGGRFEFSPERDRSATKEEVRASVTSLLTIGFKLAGAAKRLGEGEAAPVAAAEVTEGGRRAKLLGGPTPSFALATQFELGIRDGFTMGELRMCGATEMGAWTAAPGGRERFHVHLLADLEEGLNAMLPISSPPTEREILAGITPGEKMVGLDFFLRDERLLDVVLVDVRRPLEVARWLGRRPSLTIVAPPDKNVALALGKELETLVDFTGPTVLLGVGDEELRAGLETLRRSQPKGPRVQSLPGTLREGSSDLRAVLVEGLRLWAAGSGPSPSSGKAAST